MKRWSARDSEIRAAVQSSKSIAGVLRHLGMRVGGGNYQTIHRAIRDLGLDTRHWTGQGHRKGSCIPVVPARSLDEILVRGSRYNSNDLRLRLIREGRLPRKCSGCSLAEWFGAPISLEIDHRDGDRLNNEVANLRLLCPNCHALTPTYRGRNVRLRRERESRNMPQCPGGGMADTGDLRKLSPRGEIHEVKPVKFGERPEGDIRANAEPSPKGKV